MLRRLSFNKSAASKKAGEEEEEKRLKELVEKFSNEIKLHDDTTIGEGLLTPENINLLLKHGKLVFWDALGRTVQGTIPFLTPALREGSVKDKLVFRLQPESPSTVGAKLVRVFEVMGVKSAKVTISEANTSNLSGGVTIGVPEAVNVAAAGHHNMVGKQLYENTVTSPDNFLSLPSELDRDFIRKYNLSRMIEQALDSYTAFMEETCPSLSSRSRHLKLETILERDTSGTVDVKTQAKVGVNVTASSKETIQTKIELDIDFLGDTHPAFQVKRKERQQEKEEKEKREKEAEQKAREAQLELERQEKLQEIEKQCEENFIPMIIYFRKNINDELERLVNEPSLLSDWSQVIFGGSNAKNKYVYLVGLRKAGKSTLLWSMFILGLKQKHDWRSIDNLGLTKTVRDPSGVNAEASELINEEKICMLLPEDKMVSAYAMDVQGEVHDLDGYNAASPDQLTVVVVPAKNLFTSDGKLVQDFQDVLQQLPYFADAKAIVLTKWDELKFGEAKDVKKQVNAFWTDNLLVRFAEDCADQLSRQTKKRAFAFRMPIRGEGEQRSWHTLYQICSGTKDLMLHLVQQMK